MAFLNISDEEFKKRMEEFDQKRKDDDLTFRSQMKELERSRKSSELALKIHEENVKRESGVGDNSEAFVLDRNLGITSIGRRVVRLRGGAPVEKDITNFVRLKGGASQGSDCDSDGLPSYMQNDYDVDDMEIIRARREVEDFPLLVPGGDTISGKEGKASVNFDVQMVEDENGDVNPRSASPGVKDSTKPNREAQVLRSSSGGIPFEKVMIQDDDSLDEGEDGSHRISDFEAMERMAVHKASKAAFAVSKSERDELFVLKHKIQGLNNLLLKRGISMLELEQELIEGDKSFNDGNGVTNGGARDEFGLPRLKKQDDGKGGEFAAEVHNDENTTNKMGAGTSGVKDAKGAGKMVSNGKKSWSQVLKSAPPKANEVNFEYCPLPEGVDVVEPPDEILIKGAEKFRCCIVGQFSKKTLPFLRVQNVARNAWGKLGLIDVFQKNASVFIFKFESFAAKNKVLSQGTWYFDHKPLVVTEWGSEAGEKISEIPLWIKLSNIPDCYWTEEGLGRLASTIGKPLCADNLTSQMNVLPFARMCVQYKVGDPLPDKIKAVDLNPCTKAKSIVEVLVDYQQKPKVCASCKSLGHIMTVCPISINKWVRKEQPGGSSRQSDSKSEEPIIEIVDSSEAGDLRSDRVPNKRPLSPSPSSASPPVPTTGLASKIKIVDEVVKLRGILKSSSKAKIVDSDGFQKVVSKKAKNKGNSPPPPPIN